MIRRSTKVVSIKKNKLFKTNDIDINKILVSKKNLFVKKAHSNTLLDIMVMMTLNDYVQRFLKWLGMLNTLSNKTMSFKVIN